MKEIAFYDAESGLNFNKNAIFNFKFFEMLSSKLTHGGNLR